MGDASSVSELSEDLEVTHEDHLKKVVVDNNTLKSNDLTEDTTAAFNNQKRRSSPSKQQRSVVHRISKIMLSHSNGSSSNSGGGGDDDHINNQNNNNKHHRHKKGTAVVNSFLCAAPSLTDRTRRSTNTKNDNKKMNDMAAAAVRSNRSSSQQQQQQSPRQQQQQRSTPPRGNNSRRVGDNSSHTSSSGGGGAAVNGGGGDGSSTDDTGAGDKSIGVISMEGLRSVVSNQTISSHDTVKVSNQQISQQQQTQQQQQRIHAAFRRRRGNNSNSDCSQSTSSHNRSGGAGGGLLLPSVGEEQERHRGVFPKSKKRWGKLKRALGVVNHNKRQSSCSLAGVSTMTGTAGSAAGAASVPAAIHQDHHHNHHQPNFCLNLTKFVLQPRRHHASAVGATDEGNSGVHNNNKRMMNAATAFMCRTQSSRGYSSEVVDTGTVDMKTTGGSHQQSPINAGAGTGLLLADFNTRWTSRLDLARLDESIRGRMDGMDVMSLGSAMLFTPTETCTTTTVAATATAVSTPDTGDDDQEQQQQQQRHPWSILPIHYSFAGNPTDYSPAQMVTDMLRSSGGRSPPEMILEGFLPGGDDRWSVRIEEEEVDQQQQQQQQQQYRQETLQQAQCHDLLQPSLTGTTTSSNGTATARGCGDSTTTIPVATASAAAPVPTVPCCDPSPDCLGSVGHCPYGEASQWTMKTTADEYSTLEDGSPAMATHKLWSTLWGSDPAPSNNSKVLEEMHQNVADLENGNALDDPLLHLAAESSIPIDIDEDTFIVSTREHLLAIQEIATVPLSIGRFESALRVYEKLCKGLDLSVNEECRFLRGSGRHNVGLVHMWMGNFQAALVSLSRAEADRLQFLPRQHPDVAVTQTRKAQALVALGRFDEALESLEKALVLTSADQVVRAKVLNNCGVVYFLKGESFRALKCFTSALEIQRKWLETGPVVRESIVFDAAVSLGNMGKLYSHQEIADYSMSAKVYKEALLLQCNIYRPNDPVVLTSAQNYAMAKSRCTSKSNNGRRAAIRLLQTCLRLQQGVGLHKLRGVENDDDDEEVTDLPPLRLKQPLASTAVVETVGRLGYLYAQQAMYENALLCFEAVLQWQTTNLHFSTCPNAAALLSATRDNMDALRIKTIKTSSQRLDESIILATSCCVGGGSGNNHSHATDDDDVWV